MSAMNDMQRGHNVLVTYGREIESVIAISFTDDDDAYAALTLLKELDSQHQVRVQEAVVGVRGDDGKVVEKDRIGPVPVQATVGVGLLGLLIGIIGGPLGMLLGGVSGLYLGALLDFHGVEKMDSALAEIASAVRVGHPALLAVVEEQSPEVIDTAMTKLGGTIVRSSLSEVEAEIAATEKAARKATQEVHKELRRGRDEHDREAIRAKVEELKGKFHSNEKAHSRARGASSRGRRVASRKR